MTMTTSNESAHDYFAKNLHWPARARHLEDLDPHLRKSALLSRALWEALSNNDLNMEERSRVALLELAGVVADHASAAEFILNTKDMEGSK